MANEKMEELQKMAEELVEKAKVDHIDISLEDAKTFFEESSKSGELSDEEMEQVVGGDMMEEATNGFQRNDEMIRRWMLENSMSESQKQKLRETFKRIMERNMEIKIAAYPKY